MMLDPEIEATGSIPLNVLSALSDVAMLPVPPAPVSATVPRSVYVFVCPGATLASEVLAELLKVTVITVPAEFILAVPTLPFGPKNVGCESVAFDAAILNTSLLGITDPPGGAVTP